MAAGKYQQLLGLPPEVPAPDYYQLLGLERGEVDQDKMQVTMAERLTHLQSAGPDERDVAEWLRRELQRARAMLSDPDRRAEYDQKLKERRLQDLHQYVDGMVAVNTLTTAAEKALLDRMTALGLEEQEVQAAIDGELELLQAKRGTEGAGDEEALKNADERLVALMAELADRQIEEAVRGPSKAPPPPRPARVPEPATASEAPPPPAMAAAPAQVHLSQAGELSASPPPRPSKPATPVPFRPGSPTPPPRPVIQSPPPRPAPPPAPVEEKPSASADSSAEVAELKEKIETLERAKALLTQQVDRTEPARARERRWFRTLVSVLGVALAFAGGDLLAAFYPPPVIWVYDKTAGLQRALAGRGGIVWIVIGSVALILVAVMIWMAARPGRKGYMIPAGSLAFLAFAIGAWPLGHEETLESEMSKLRAELGEMPRRLKDLRNWLDERDKDLADQKTSYEARIAAIRQEADKIKAEVDARIAEKDAEVKKIAGERDMLSKMVEEQTALKKQILEMKQKVADLEAAKAKLEKDLEEARKKGGRK